MVAFSDQGQFWKVTRVFLGEFTQPGNSVGCSRLQSQGDEMFIDSKHPSSKPFRSRGARNSVCGLYITLRWSLGGTSVSVAINIWPLCSRPRHLGTTSLLPVAAFRNA